MAKTASLNIRIDPETKTSAEELFGAFGITLTDAVNMFLRQSLMVGGLPFQLKKPRYNSVTDKAIYECEEMIQSGKYAEYSSAKEMHVAILAEDYNV